SGGRFELGKEYTVDVRAAPEPPVNWQALLGYLNFAEGKPDPRFQSQLHAAFLLAGERSSGPSCVTRLADLLDEQLTALHHSGAAPSADTRQARAVVPAALRELPPAYRQHHSDLLSQQSDETLFTPFFLARACEAVLAARVASGNGGPARLADDAIHRLN